MISQFDSLLPNLSIVQCKMKMQQYFLASECKFWYITNKELQLIFKLSALYHLTTQVQTSCHEAEN
jgi:hypothetical protein